MFNKIQKRIKYSSSQLNVIAGWKKYVYLPVKRAFDLAFAVFLVTFLSPVWIVLAVLLRFNGPVILRVRKIGIHEIPFDEYEWSGLNTRFDRFLKHWPIVHVPALFNILKGNMSLVGPRPLTVGELKECNNEIFWRFSVKPGLICYWWLRSKSNINYGNEWKADEEYVQNAGLWTDASIILRSIPAFFLGIRLSEFHEELILFGIPIHNVTMNEAIRRMIKWVDEDHAPRHICFVNSDYVNIACRDSEYWNILQKSDMNLADGIGMKLAGKILNRNIRQNVNGTDLFPFLCETLAGTSIGLFLLGGKPGVAEDVRNWIAQWHPDVIVKGTHHGYFSHHEEGTVIKMISESKADMLLVAMGVPLQERWIHYHLEETGVRLAIGVGGLFDFYSGRIPRAPIWIREIGMEWFYRFCQEPGRMWKRYLLGNIIFLCRVFKEKWIVRRKIH